MDASRLNPSPLDQGPESGLDPMTPDTIKSMTPRLSWLGPLLIIAAALLLFAAKL